MRRVEPLCPVTGCGATRRPYQPLCGTCWRRLPQYMRDAITAARQARAPHLRAKAEMAATAWLCAHSVAGDAARRCGEDQS